MVGAASRHIWTTVGWVGAVTATVLNGVVVGYGAIWLQFFGETADGEDYAVSAGGYGASTVVLAAALPAIRAHAGPRWLVWPTGASAVVLGSSGCSLRRGRFTGRNQRVTRRHGLGRHG